MPPPALSPFGRRLLFAAQIAFAALGVIAVLSRIFWLQPHNLTRNDFTENYASAREWSHGGDPYGKTRELIRRHVGPDANLADLRLDHRNPHPPALIMLYRPVSTLSYEAARVIWLIVTTAVLVAALALMLRALGMPPASGVLVAAGSLVLPVAQKLIQFLQFEGVILALFIAAWMSLRRDGERSAGLALGLAAAFKLYPAFLVVPLLRLRRFRTIAAAAATASVVSLVTLGLTGFDATRSFLRETGPDNFDFYRAAPFNISLFAVPMRWLAANDWRAGIDVPALGWVLALGVFVAGFYAAARTRAQVTGDVFWSAVPIMLLIMPLTWDFSLALCLPVIYLTVHASLTRSELPSLPVLVAALGIMVGIPFGFTPAQPGTSTALQYLPYVPPTLFLLWYVLLDARTKRLGSPG